MPTDKTMTYPFPYKTEDGLLGTTPDPFNVENLNVNKDAYIKGDLQVDGKIKANETEAGHFTATDITNQYRTTSEDFELQSLTTNPEFFTKNIDGITYNSTFYTGAIVGNQATFSKTLNNPLLTSQENKSAGILAETGFRNINDTGDTMDVVLKSSNNGKRGVVRTSSQAFGCDVEVQGSGKTIKLITNGGERMIVTDTGVEVGLIEGLAGQFVALSSTAGSLNAELGRDTPYAAFVTGVQVTGTAEDSIRSEGGLFLEGGIVTNGSITSNGITADNLTISGKLEAGEIESNSSISAVTSIGTLLGSISGRTIEAYTSILAGTHITAIGNVTCATLNCASLNATGNISTTGVISGNIVNATTSFNTTGAINGGVITGTTSLNTVGPINGGVITASTALNTPGAINGNIINATTSFNTGGAINGGVINGGTVTGGTVTGGVVTGTTSLNTPGVMTSGAVATGAVGAGIVTCAAVAAALNVSGLTLSIGVILGVGGVTAGTFGLNAVEIGCTGEVTTNNFACENNANCNNLTAFNLNADAIGVNNPGSAFFTELTVLGYELRLGSGNQVDRGDSGLSRALFKGDGNKLIINAGNDFTGGVLVESDLEITGTFSTGAAGFTTLNNTTATGSAINVATIGATTRGTGAFTTITNTTAGGTDLNAATIGATTPGTGSFTTITNTTAGGTDLNAATIGSITPGTGAFTTITNTTAGGTDLNAATIGATTPGTGAFTDLTVSGTFTVPPQTFTTLNNTTATGSAINVATIGATTRGTGAFTTITNTTAGGTDLNAATIGATTPGTGAFTTITNTTAGGTDLNAATIGAITPGTGSFTDLTVSGTFTVPPQTFSTLNNTTAAGSAINVATIGATTRGTGAFTTITNTTAGGTDLNAATIGATTPGTGSFTTLSASGITTTDRLINLGFEMNVGGGDQVSRGDSGLSRAIVKGNGNRLILNFASDYTGGVLMMSALDVEGNINMTNATTLNIGASGTSNTLNVKGVANVDAELNVPNGLTSLNNTTLVNGATLNVGTSGTSSTLNVYGNAIANTFTNTTATGSAINVATIGATTPGDATFNDVTVLGTYTGPAIDADFTTLNNSVAAGSAINVATIGATTRGTGAFTTITNTTAGGTDLNAATIGATTPGTGAFTDLTVSGTFTVPPQTFSTLNNTTAAGSAINVATIGATTRGTGAFTTMDVSGITTTDQLKNLGFELNLGAGDQVSRGDSGQSRALVKGNGNRLIVNYTNDYTGGVLMMSALDVEGNINMTNATTLNVGASGTSNILNVKGVANVDAELNVPNGLTSLNNTTLVNGATLNVGTSGISSTLNVNGTTNVGTLNTGTANIGDLRAKGFDLRLGDGDQTTRGDTGESRALVKTAGSVLTMNFGGDYTGGVNIDSNAGVDGNLAVTGSFSVDGWPFPLIQRGRTPYGNTDVGDGIKFQDVTFAREFPVVPTVVATMSEAAGGGGIIISCYTKNISTTGFRLVKNFNSAASTGYAEEPADWIAVV